MGWLFTYGQSKSQLIEHLTVTNLGDRMKTIAKCVRGNVLWAVHEYVRDIGVGEGAIKAGDRWIGCYLLGSTEGSWGYKDMDESMGPCEITCPVSYFKLVPNPPNDWAKEWRAKVMARHAKKSVKLKYGDTIKLRAGCTPPELRVIEVKGQKVRAVALGGGVYNVPRRLIDSVIT